MPMEINWSLVLVPMRRLQSVIVLMQSVKDSLMKQVFGKKGKHRKIVKKCR